MKNEYIKRLRMLLNEFESAMRQGKDSLPVQKPDFVVVLSAPETKGEEDPRKREANPENRRGFRQERVLPGS